MTGHVLDRTEGLFWDSVQDMLDVIDQIEARGWRVTYRYGPDEDGVITLFILPRLDKP